MFYVYNTLLIFIGIPLFLLYLPFFLASKRHRRNFFARCRPPSVSPPEEGEVRVWVHAVSVGETLAALPLVRKLKVARPDVKIYFSTITVTGMEVARKRLKGLVENVFYLPFDFYPLMSETARRVSPEKLIIMETEIWPNLIWACRRRGVRLFLVNGRFSDRSFPRYRKVRPFMRSLFREFDALLMQSREDAGKIARLGAPLEKVSVPGNVKFDMTPPTSKNPELVEAVREISRERKVLLGASTHEGEEEALARLCTDRDDIFLVIAPRHPERFDRAEEVVRSKGFKTLRRTRLSGNTVTNGVDCLILDTLGELSTLYPAADLVFVGGTLVPVGGHNLLEPAFYGKAVVTGPHLENVKEIAQVLKGKGALFVVRDPEELKVVVSRLLDDPVGLERAGEAGRQVVEENRGVCDRVVERIFADGRG